MIFTTRIWGVRGSLRDLYERWRSHHRVSNPKRLTDEKHKRFNVFKENVMHAHNTNKMDKPYKLKLNRFADMTNNEFRSTYAGSMVKHHRMLRGTPRGSGSFMYEKVDRVSHSVDWRKKAVAAVEGVNQIKTNKLVSLSGGFVLISNSTRRGCLLENVAQSWIMQLQLLAMEQPAMEPSTA